MKCGLVHRSWLIRAGGWLWTVTGRGPSAARRVLRSPERLQQPSGEANVNESSLINYVLLLTPRESPPQTSASRPLSEIVGLKHGDLICSLTHALVKDPVYTADSPDV